ncbi:MAG: Cysteine desulfurase [Candidatus Wolfebacteria bacterium GW2011_GWC2_39_22]|uniref:cysteine desulfurase n=1 Tax=Candidatus Wolfebacteria bacterium GW2011_GWC2_39_22 TaxID=1619013 RepID=A0A0G0NB05_9BACT|nr:MAG: Cysteine desulfurase [Candidatus Wolfebacteria bacterium GW2011_GWC2_39_22]HBI26101.1 cysteine desulfurase NifS [Candidatus Wolfebacteria bacterium]
MQRIYLDNAATTPLDKEVKQAMEPYFGDTYGNPSSLHWFGQQARAAIDASRETIANAIGARFREVVFTGSATEANNLALRGAVQSAKDTFSALNGDRPMKIIICTIEHDSVLETARDLEKEGVEVVRIPVATDGTVDVRQVEAALDERTVLVSIMYANNEIGTIQPIKEIANSIKRFRARENALPYYPLFHTDAVQAFQFLDCAVDALGVDLMTLSAHKLYGPKGVGALYVRTMNSVAHTQGDRTSIIRPRVSGGGQEFGMRSGTENVAAIAGFAKAVTLIAQHKESEYKRLQLLRERLWKGIQDVCPKAIVNGKEMDSRVRGNDKPTLPNILNVYFPGRKGGDLLIALDMQGVAVSSGSACAAFSAKPSHVLMALGFDDDRAGGSLRFSMGRHTTEDEIDGAIDALRVVLTAQ